MNHFKQKLTQNFKGYIYFSNNKVKTNADQLLSQQPLKGTYVSAKCLFISDMYIIVKNMLIKQTVKIYLSIDE